MAASLWEWLLVSMRNSGLQAQTGGLASLRLGQRASEALDTGWSPAPPVNSRSL